jgi:hypothetical protein
MELIGQAFFTLDALACSICAAFLCVLIRPLRKFTLAVLITPPVAVFSLFLMWWIVLDSGQVCGPDPEWDRCPATTIRIIGWICWFVLVSGSALAAYFAQRVFQTGAGSFLFRHSPTTLFQHNND